MKAKRIFTTTMLSLVALLAALPATAADIASGTNGGCSWVISEDGVLTISPIEGKTGRLTGKFISDSYKSSIKKVVVEKGVSIESQATGLFYGLSNCTEMDVVNLNVCRVVNLDDAFRYCSSLKTLDLTGWDTHNVKKLYRTFEGCTSLTEIKGIENWNMSNLAWLWEAFHDCKSLTSLDLSKWDVSNVNTMKGMFQGCSSLTSLNLSGWDVGKVDMLAYAFEGCSSLKTLDLSWKNTSKLADLDRTFNGCSSLPEIKGLEDWDGSNVQYMRQTFRNCSSLTSLDLSKWNVSKVTMMYATFVDCSSLASLYLTNWDISNVTSVTNTFNACNKLGEGDSVLVTPKTVGSNVPTLPYTMYDWDNNNAEYTTLPGGSLKLHKEKQPGTEEMPGDVYILGNVNGNGWAPNVGVQMTAGTDSIYTASVTTAGEYSGYSLFSFTHKLAESADDWDGIAKYRFGPADGYMFIVTDELLGTPLNLDADGTPDNPFQIAAGTWNFVVDMNARTLTITDASTPQTLLGDVNLDGRVDAADIACIVNIITGKDPAGTYGTRDDVNKDTQINSGDIAALVAIITGSTD